MSAITFEMLTVGQKNAFEIVKKRVAEGLHTTIRGPAGTGKTTMMKFLLDEFTANGMQGMILATPTHQAKKVLSRATGYRAVTIHSVLKISPTTYEECNIFEQKEMPDMSKCRVIIVDEASMVDRKLFEILMNSIPEWCVVIAVGDPAQLRPVVPGSNEGHISPFFTDPRFVQTELSEIKRSNDTIIRVATDIRNGKWIYAHNDGVNQGVFEHTEFQTLMRKYLNEVGSINTPGDMDKVSNVLLENRFLAFTNKSVEKMNQIVRKYVYKTEDPYIVGEILVMQEPFMKSFKMNGKSFEEIVFNNGQFVRVLNVREMQFPVKCDELDAMLIKGYSIEVESHEEDDEDYAKAWLKVIPDENERFKLNGYLAKAAETYKEMKREGKRPNWKSFWQVKRDFINVKALPASTIHKSQGTSVDNVYLWTPCLKSTMVDPELAMQLLYVGTTRARFRVDVI